MKTKQLFIAGSLLFLTFILSPTVLAEETPPDKLPSQALESFKKGMKAAEQKEWQIAIRYFSEAQEKAPRAPEILFNLGLAESKVPGRELRALAWFHAYLAAAPTAPNVKAVRDECENLEIRIEAMLARLVEQAKVLANAFPERSGGPTRDAALRDVARMQARTGDVNGAKQLASTLSDEWFQRGDAYGGIAVAQLEAGKPADAKETARLVPDDREDSLEAIAKGLAEAGDISGAKSIVSRIRGSTYNPSACAAIATIQARAGDIEGAKETLNSAKGRFRLHEGFIAVAQAQAKAGKTDEARRTLVQARDVIAPKGGSPMFDYKAVGEAQAALGDIENAKQTAALITGADGPSVSCRNWISEAIGNYWAQRCEEAVKKGDFKAATEAVSQLSGNAGQKRVQEIMDARLREIVQEKIKTRDSARALTTAESMGDTYLRSYAYRDLAEERLAVGDLDGAIKMVEHVSESNDGDKTALLVKIARGFLRAHEPRRAQSHLLKARTEVRAVTGYSKRNCLCDIAAAQIEMHDWASAKETAGLSTSTKEDSDAASVLSCIAQKLAEAGDITGALQMANSIVYKENTYKDGALHSIAKAQANGGDLAAALRTVSKIEGAKEKAETYKDIAYYQGSLGNFEAARQVADLIPTDIMKASAYEGLGGQFFYAHRIAEGREAFTQAKSILDNVRDPKARIEGYVSLAGHYSYYWGDVAEARALLAKARSLAPGIEDPESRAYYYVHDWRGIAPAEIGIGLLAEARETLWLALEAVNQVKDSHSKGMSQWNVARRLVEAGDLTGAKEVANCIAGDTRDYVLCEIAKKWVGYGNFKNATTILKEIESLEKKEDIYAEIVVRQARQGDLATARQTAMGIVRNESAKGKAWSAIVKGYLKTNDLESAKAAANQSGYLYDAEGAGALIEAGEIAWGQQRAFREKDVARKQDILAHIAKAQAKAGDIAGAKKTAAMINNATCKYVVCKALAEAGEIAWAAEYAADMQSPSAQLAIAQAQIKLGDKAGAVKTLRNLKGKWTSVSALESYAFALAQAGESEGAKAVLTPVCGKDFNFDGWLGHQTAQNHLSATNFIAASQAAAGITDTYWKSKAYAQIAEAGFDQPAVRDWLAAIPDPARKSLASIKVIDRLVDADKLSDASGVADLIPDDNFKVMAINKIVTAAIAKDDMSVVMPKVIALPDGAGKTQVLVNILRSSAGGFDRTTVVGTAVKSADAMGGTIWKAMTCADIAQAAASAGNTTGSGDIQRTVQALATTFGRADQALWAIYTTLRKGTPVPIVHIPTQEERQSAETIEKRVKEWTGFIDYSLKEQLFTDPQGYIKSLQTKTNPNEIFNGVVNVGNTIVERLRTIKKMEADQTKTATGRSN